MKLSRQQFDKKLEAGDLCLAFIGMSNVGKSHMARKIARAYGFTHIEIDRLIWQALGFQTMTELAQWQGQPYEPDYATRETRIIALEAECLQTALTQTRERTIIDAPGSIIYVPQDIRNSLKAQCYIVHIKANTQDIERLQADYFNHPKPLAWAGHYKIHPTHTHTQTIRTCYPKLLESRTVEYAKLADTCLDASTLRTPDNNPDTLMEALRPAN